MFEPIMGFKKSCIRETLTLWTDAGNKTDTKREGISFFLLNFFAVVLLSALVKRVIVFNMCTGTRPSSTLPSPCPGPRWRSWGLGTWFQGRGRQAICAFLKFRQSSVVAEVVSFPASRKLGGK